MHRSQFAFCLALLCFPLLAQDGTLFTSGGEIDLSTVGYSFVDGTAWVEWNPTTEKITLSDGFTYEQALRLVLRQYNTELSERYREAEHMRERRYNNTTFTLGKIHDALSAITHAKPILKEDTSKADQLALTAAMDAWSRALGPQYHISRPRLIIGGDGACDTENDSIACSYADRIVIDHWSGQDKVTVMMHEIGHTLGVPHIAGDALMNAVLMEKPVKFPTPDAIALAKLHQGKR